MTVATPDPALHGTDLPRVIGLLITRDDEAILDEWCRSELRFYEAVVCLDGSTSGATEEIARAHCGRLIHVHERDFAIPRATDHGLRRIVHEEIVRRFGRDRWIMCCHADEFCYHDPRRIAALAERQGYDLVSWYSPHFYPHPSELADWETRRARPVTERHRHYHWGHRGTGLPWIEDRLYRDGPGVAWDETTHGSVRPHGLGRRAPFHPIYRHYKVVDAGTHWCEVDGGSTYYRHHWVGLEHRTGLPFEVRRFEDLFVERIRDYAIRDRFDGHFDQPWNLGEEFRPAGERGGSGVSCPDEAATRSPRGRSPDERRVLRVSAAGHSVDFHVRGRVDEAIVEGVFARDAYDLGRLPEPGTVLDVGAHIGAFALLANVRWPGARIVACEADPENAELLVRHVSGRPAIEVVEAAVVAEETPRIAFHAVADKGALNSGGGSCVRSEPGSRPIEVPAISVVRLWRERAIDRCDLLKLDCEGSETVVLSALARAGLLGRVGHIVGEWHAEDGRPESVAHVRRLLRSILAATHTLTFAERHTGREGHFAAVPRRLPPAQRTGA